MQQDEFTAFPEYLTNTQQDEELLNQCIQQFEILIDTQDPNQLRSIEQKLTIVLHQTPVSSVVQLYQNLANEYNLSAQTFKVSRFHNQINMPSIQKVNDFIDGKLNQLPWPIIGNVSSQELQEYLIKIYNFNYGRVALHELPLLWFPKLLQPYINTIESLFNTQTKLTQDEKYYLAVIGTAASGSQQLYNHMVKLFYYNNGDQNWMDIGYEVVDDHIKQLDPIFKLLITKPWEQQLSIELEKLLKNKWRRKELIQALIIFIFYNNMGCFSLGNGINTEIDQQDDSFQNDNSFHIEQIIDQIQNESILQELKQQNDNEIEIQVRKKSNQAYSFYVEESEQLKLHLPESFQKYFKIQELQYDEGLSVLRSSEYSYEMNTYPVLKESFNEGAKSINDFLQEVKQMTRNSFGNEQEITTSAFRKAIRYYGEGQFRYQHDHIDYSTQMEKLLPEPLRKFIQLLMWSPNAIQKSHIEQIKLSLQADELCHITLLTVAARIETQLIYLSKSLVEFM